MVWDYGLFGVRGIEYSIPLHKHVIRGCQNFHCSGSLKKVQLTYYDGV